MLYRTLFASALSLVPLLSPLYGEDVILDHSDAEDAEAVAKWGQDVSREEGAGRNGSAAFVLTKNRAKLLSPNWIEIDPEKTYQLEGYFRSASAEKPASAYFGLYLYDSEKRFIAIQNVRTHEGSATELLEDAREGESSLVVGAVPDREKDPNTAIAFNAKDDLSDLPNFEISPRTEAYTPRAEGGFSVTLREPLTSSYPKGTKVRFHSPWKAGLYWVANEWVPTDWTRYSTTLHGVYPDTIGKDRFWAGTRYVRVLMELGNWDRVPEEGAKLYADDLTFKEVPAAKATE